MLHSIEKLSEFTIQAADGEIGRLSDLYFDDETWIIRYFVADTGDWLPDDRKVLLAPAAFKQIDEARQSLLVDLTRDQVKESPPVDVDLPLSRRREAQLYAHYRWPVYWTGGGNLIDLHTTGVDAATFLDSVAEKSAPDRPTPEHIHLRSVQEVIGYHIRARDGEIGHVEDFIAEDETWTIQYMIVDTGNWLPGKQVLLAPSWVEQVSWTEGEVEVDLTRETVENSPEYDPALPLNREYEVRLHQHYDRPGYWS